MLNGVRSHYQRLLHKYQDSVHYIPPIVRQDFSGEIFLKEPLALGHIYHQLIYLKHPCIITWREIFLSGNFVFK